jgi:hypothetical protein
MALKAQGKPFTEWDEDILGNRFSNTRSPTSLAGNQAWSPTYGQRLLADGGNAFNQLASTQFKPDHNYGNWFSNMQTPDWLNSGNMEGFGSAMKGIGSLASGWAALKNLKLTRQSLDNQQNQWQSDYDAQRLTTNNQIANQNAWKKAQGRTDYGSYVGGKPTGTAYIS